MKTLRQDTENSFTVQGLNWPGPILQLKMQFTVKRSSAQRNGFHYPISTLVVVEGQGGILP